MAKASRQGVHVIGQSHECQKALQMRWKECPAKSTCKAIVVWVPVIQRMRHNNNKVSEVPGTLVGTSLYVPKPVGETEADSKGPSPDDFRFKDEVTTKSVMIKLHAR